MGIEIDNMEIDLLLQLILWIFEAPLRYLTCYITGMIPLCGGNRAGFYLCVI